MESERENKRKRGSGRCRDENKTRKDSGKSFVTYKGVQKPAKVPPQNEVTCKCYFDCKTLRPERMRHLNEELYKQNTTVQGTYLMTLIHLAPVSRRRNGLYEDSSDSRRQHTVHYTVSNAKGEMIRICKTTFMNIFSVTKKRLECLIKKKKLGHTTYTDKRTSNKPKKFNEQDTEMIKTHIRSVPRQESHYCRKKSSLAYLSPDLNIRRLYDAFRLQHPETKITMAYYRSVFKNKFPNLKFHLPRTDTCRVCDLLNCEVKAATASSNNAKVKLELHHRKVEAASQKMRQDLANSKLPGSSFSCVVMDLQQVLFVPSLTHSDMFYLSQLSCYNLGIYVSDINRSFMCTWHEGVAGRGSNEIASCLLSLLNKEDAVTKNELRIWTDNCAGQNRNKILILLYIFLVTHKVFNVIEHKFLVSGHSFMQCDRDFGLIEKRKRLSLPMVPKDLHDIIKTAKYNPPFQIIDMEEHVFLDLKKTADHLLDTKNLQISKLSEIRVHSGNPAIIEVKQTHSELENWKGFNVLIKHKTILDIKNAILDGLPSTNKISDNKKKSLKSMIGYLQNENHKQFYRQLLSLD
ncbi:uncharacterized protein [Onthophagus taurus]|uniref:uncharacterized protein n=1 Tax=Onthophagus taurus TaxID=166361 RepID=UPI0039BEAA5A